jgi:hypothetical protein
MLQQFYNNAVAAFIGAAFFVLLYNGFNASKIPAFTAGADYYIEML